MNAIEEIFGKSKAIIAMAHFPPLPGQPLYDASGGLAKIREVVSDDVDRLAAAGADGILFCNEGDRPYRAHAGHETVAVMSSVIQDAARGLRIPFGADVLWDPQAAIAIAFATGARFVREVFTGVYSSDFGIWNTDPAGALRFRRELGASDLRCFYNITAEFASPLAARPIELTARSAVFSSLADAICVSGSLTGTAPDIDVVAAVKRAVPDTAVIVNTGVRADTVGKFLNAADAVIVGTALKRDGVTWNPVDADRAKSFIAAAAGTGVWSPGPARTPAMV
ncbi:MAG TPA: BtpA/SgcQ family protein [Candidatus Dormibacteraeota bacterium]|nr:BtpA/SgcQ family protein [Candidatus Dormibacteraeota bacterium]